MDKQVTIKTIAKHVNFSLTTVSRVLNGTSEKYRISKATQEIVLKEANKLGYIPNMAAKTLRSNRSRTIGLMVPSLSNPFFSKIASTVSKMLHAQDYVVLMSDCDNNESDEKKMLQTLQAQNLLGLIAIPLGEIKNYEGLSASALPIVFVDRFFVDFDYFAVSTNHYKSASALVQYLVDHGHQRIACIQGDNKVISNTYRVQGYTDALAKNNLSYHYLGGVGFTEEEGYLETKALLKSKPLPSAILALSDTILLGVLKALKEANMRIPDDISVVSFDNSNYLDYLQTPITSVAQPITQIAQLAVTLLLEQLSEDFHTSEVQNNKVLLLDSELILRTSVKNLSTI